jgi:uncharacterized phage protein (TIGR01671 family)
MQDRFRYRVWNKAANKFEEKCIVYNDGRLCIVHNNSRAYVNGNPNYVLMQCTGLEDKNGKLIYEGDIVSIDDGELKGIAQRHDQFDEYYGCIEIKLICKYETIYKPTVFAESEVIGNIYENKELLEQ